MMDCILHYKYSYGITAAHVPIFYVQDTVSKFACQAKGRLVHFQPETQIPWRVLVCKNIQSHPLGWPP